MKKLILGVFVFASALIGQVHAANILFLVGNTTLNTGDATIKTTLEGMGHTLTIKTCASSLASDTSAKALVTISSTCVPTDVNTKFLNVKTPVLTWESDILDDMKMTGITSGTHFGNTASVTQITI